MTKMNKEGVKYDNEKAPYHLLPPELLQGVSEVLQFGARKYATRNWELGMDWSRCFSALMRHMWAWWRGETLDPETKLSHLKHAAACVAFLIAYEERKVGLDDRPKEDTKARMVQDTEVLLEEQGVMPSDSNCSLFSYTECPKDRGAPNEWS
jgi:hypothetical protein